MPPIFENDPALEDAFLTLLGERQPPPYTDKASYLRRCQVALEDAIDRVEIRRTGKPVFRQFPHQENTTTLHLEIGQDNQSQTPIGLLEESNK